jgi:hypothetical protein
LSRNFHFDKVWDEEHSHYYHVHDTTHAQKESVT